MCGGGAGAWIAPDTQSGRVTVFVPTEEKSAQCFSFSSQKLQLAQLAFAAQRAQHLAGDELVKNGDK